MEVTPPQPPDAGAGPSIVPFGEDALLAVFGASIDVELNRRVHALASLVREERAGGAGWGPPVPGYGSLLVPYDPGRSSLDRARRELRTLCRRLPDASPAEERGEEIEVRVRYGGTDGPDLDEVAGLLGLRPADVVELHCSVAYRVFLLGFSPGFAYLGELPAALRVPRRASPRTRVAAGSVGIAGAQTGIYPRETPGGWQLIGRTDAVLWDVRRDPPALLTPGDRVRFRPA